MEVDGKSTSKEGDQISGFAVGLIEDQFLRRPQRFVDVSQVFGGAATADSTSLTADTTSITSDSVAS
jgi:hypothetical protein